MIYYFVLKMTNYFLHHSNLLFLYIHFIDLNSIHMFITFYTVNIILNNEYINNFHNIAVYIFFNINIIAHK